MGADPPSKPRAVGEVTATSDLIESRPRSGSLASPAPATRARAVSPLARWLAVATAGAFLLAEAGRILVRRPHVVLYGDQALLELGARRAMHLDQLVGPYSRSGFHHPGPAVFYVLAPFVRLLEPAGPGLYLGARSSTPPAWSRRWPSIWRRVGPLAALWAAAAIGLFCLCLGVGTLREPWNPYLIVAPMVLFVVLWAAGWTGSRRCGCVGLRHRFLPHSDRDRHGRGGRRAVAGLAFFSAAPGPERRPAHPAPGRWGPGGVIGVVLLALIWVAAVVELFRDRPNNLQLLWDFFTGATRAGAARRSAWPRTP